MRAEPRLLLVDIVVLDRFHSGFMLPYVQGWAGARGLATRALSFGLRAAEAAAGGVGAHLPESVLVRLAAEIGDFAPTHVLLSHAPSAALRAELEGPFALAWFDYELFTVHGPGGSVQPLVAWLGADPGAEDREALHAEILAAPDFKTLHANEGMARWRPLPFLVCGTECAHRQSVAANPFYEGVDLTDCRRQRGCAFCHLYGDDGVPRGLGLDVVEAQIRQAVLDIPGDRHRRRFRVMGFPVFAQVDDFVQRARRAGARATDFLFSVRADEVVRYEDRLRAALAQLERDRDGNRLQLFLIGVENFSQAELDRLNKGLAVPTLFGMFRLLRELEALHPKTFDFREYGGLSTILYTPWTSLDDLALNLAAVRHLRVERLCGKLLGSRLRLYRELPLTQRAAADGLLLERYDDPLLDTARRNLYPDEVPWRFAHPEVELFCRLALRLEADPALAGDALHEQVRRLGGGALPVGPEAIAVAQRLLAAIARGEREPAAILGEALARGGERGAP